MGRLLVLVGLMLAGIGLLVMLGLPLGRLPGDVAIRRGHTTVYLPITSSILLSVILTVLIMWLRR